MNVPAVFEEFISRYVSCREYEDVGCIRQWSFPDHDRPKPSVEFCTKYKAPAVYKFEWHKNNRTGLVESDDAETYFSYGLSKRLKSKALYLALAQATGVIGSGALVIPCILFPSVKENMNAWTEGFSEITPKQDEEIEGISCYKLVLERPSGLRTTIWLEKDKFTLRRYQTMTSCDFNASTEPSKEVPIQLYSQATFTVTEIARLDYSLITEITYTTTKLIY